MAEISKAESERSLVRFTASGGGGESRVQGSGFRVLGLGRRFALHEFLRTAARVRTVLTACSKLRAAEVRLAISIRT